MKISHLILLILIMAVVAYGVLVAPEVVPDPLRPIFAVLFLAEYFTFPIVMLIAYGTVADAIWRVAKYGNGHSSARCASRLKDHI